MHNLRVLEFTGCSPARLREIFTSKGLPDAPDNCSDDVASHFNDPEYKKRKKKADDNATIRLRFEDKIRGRVYEGIANNAKNSRPIQAVDLAWDSKPIHRETIPLMLWATGKITDTRALYGALCGVCNETPGASASTANKFFKKIPTDSEIGEVDGRICEIAIDIMHSYVTRIHSGLDALWSNIWPLYKYNPRSSDAVAQLRGDALTQRVDMICEAYNYRHLDSQCRRDMVLYGRSFKFPRSAWDRKTAWRFKQNNLGVEDPKQIESFVVREGIDFVNPPVGRVFGDMSAPFANVNSDTGPKYMGYWGIYRYGALMDSSAGYYNVDSISSSTGFQSLIAQNSLYFNYYFDPKVLSLPAMGQEAPALYNDREARVGYYSSACRDNGVLITEYFERVNPKVEGIGDYDSEVWLRLTVAGDYTVINAEFMPSIPCAYGAINWNDNRVDNQSIGMSLLGYQDQATNITSHAIMMLRASMIQLWLIDKDSLEEPIRKEIEKNAMNSSWWIDPKILVYSATKLRDLGIADPSQAFKIIHNNVTGVMESCYKSLAQLISVADRLLILSPNELGQPNPREVAAREVQEISTSVQSISSFRQQGPREQVAATKQILYESTVCCATDLFRVPVEGKYTRRTLKAAGFTVDPLVDKATGDQPSPDTADNQVVPVKTPITGNLRNLVYDYYFDDRDGAERVVNTQGATVVMQMLQSLLKIPGVAQKMGLKNIYDAANTVIRMSGAPWNFQLSLADGEDGNIPPDGPPPEQQQAAQQAQQQMTEVVQQMAGRIQRLEGILSKILGQPAGGGEATQGGAPGPAAPAPTPAPGPAAAPGAALMDSPPPA